MALRVRVTATHGPHLSGPVPPLVYRAEAYDEDDLFREPRWNCAHDHRSVELALNCGQDWLDGKASLESR